MPYFWAIANTQILQEYNLEIARLETFNFDAANYLKSVNQTCWVTAFYLGPYHGHKASNVVEATNKVFKDYRELPILDLLNTIWHYTMNHRFKYQIKAIQLKSQIHTPYAYK